MVSKFQKVALFSVKMAGTLSWGSIKIPGMGFAPEAGLPFLIN